MKFVRFSIEAKEKLGIIENDIIKEIKGDFFNEYSITDKEYKNEDVKILPPCIPTKIVAIGLIYKDHIEELGFPFPDEPIIFFKPTTGIIGHEDAIIYPSMTSRVDYEAELAIVIKDKIKDIDENDASKHVLGYTCFNDVTARDLQKKDVQWTRAKAFDTFSPVGPCIVDDIDPNNVLVESYLNGELKQSSNTKNFIFKVEKLISFISKVMTLLPGDIIATGTPYGVGPMNSGDVIEIKIEGIGTLKNHIKKA